jgi:hypothetical protein
VIQFIIRDKNDTHAPASVGAKHSAELVPGKFMIVYMDNRQEAVLASSIIDQTA